MPLHTPQPEFFTTADGSLTCFHAETHQHYHNRAGAYTEALVQYALPSDLPALLSTERHISLLDACFGLGYNTWAFLNTCLAWSNEHPQEERTLSIFGIEQDPGILQKIPFIFEFATLEPLKFFAPLFEHNTYYQTLEDEVLSTTFAVNSLQIHFSLALGDLRQIIAQLQQPFHLIYHDPFSPNKVPELWSTDLFARYAQLLDETCGSMLTYSTAGAVSAGLLEAGFSIYRTEALGNKCGGTLASKITLTPSDLVYRRLRHLHEPEKDFLKSTAGIPYRDLSLNSSRQTILAYRLDEQARSQRITSSELRHKILHK